MTDKINWWKAEDAAALKQSRSSAEMSREEFARQLCISKKQLTELEEGGSSAFYSEQIKYQTGAKILGYFDILTAREQEIKESSASVKLMAESQNRETIAQLDNVIETNKRDLAPEAHSHTSNFQIRNGYVLGAVLVVAAIVAVIYTPHAPPNKQAPIRQVASAAASPQAPREPPQKVTEEQKTEEFSANEKEQPATEIAESQSITCQWEGTPMSLKPIAADRPADRIHLIANSDLQLCLKDGAGQVRVIKLQAGDRQTFYGSGAPWYIYSPQMVYLKVFFQGYHVFIPKEDTHFVKLNAHF